MAKDSCVDETYEEFVKRSDEGITKFLRLSDEDKRRACICHAHGDMQAANRIINGEEQPND